MEASTSPQYYEVTIIKSKIMKYERFKTNDPFTVEGEKGPEGN